MQDLLDAFVAKGGTIPSWNEGLQGGLSGVDMAWQDAKMTPGSMTLRAQSLMTSGGYLEYRCYDGRGQPQGSALLRLKAWESQDHGLLAGDHLSASDEYYQWYAEQELGEGRGIYHVCEGPRRNCGAALPRGDRRELVHLEEWRVVNPLIMMESPYMQAAAREAMRRFVQDYQPRPEEPERGGDLTGLDKAAKAVEAAQRESRVPEKEALAAAASKSKPEKRDEAGKGSVRSRLEERARLRGRLQAVKEETEKRERKRKRSRSPGRRRSRRKCRGGSREGSNSEESSGTRSSESFHGPSTRGEVELWRQSLKNPGRLLKGGMKELSRYLADRDEGPGEEGDWMSRKVMAYVNQVVLTSHPPQTIGVRNHRELITLGTGLDLLLQGKLPELGDLLMQRLKALETSLTDQNWSTARHQELIPAQGASLTGISERRQSAKNELQMQKLREMTAKMKPTK